MLYKIYFRDPTRLFVTEYILYYTYILYYRFIHVVGYFRDPIRFWLIFSDPNRTRTSMTFENPGTTIKDFIFNLKNGS